MKNYEQFVHYLSQDLWRCLSSERGIAAEKLVDHLISLGLRNPSETTMQRVTAVLLLCTEGEAAIRTMPPMALHEIYKNMKRTLKTRSKGNPMFYVEVLPPSPEQFRTIFADMHKAMFGQTGPVSCPFAQQTISAVAECIPMRATKKAMAPLSSGPLQLAQGLLSQLMMLQQSSHGQLAASSMDGLVQIVQPRVRLGPLHAAQSQSLALQDWRPQAATIQAGTQIEDLGARAAPPATPVPVQAVVSDAPLTVVPDEASSASTLASVVGDGTGAQKEEHLNQPRLPTTGKIQRQSVADASKVILKAMSEKAEKTVMKRPASTSETKTTSLKCSMGSCDSGKHDEQKRPSVSVERSRKQVLCRTGRKGPGQNHAIPFGSEGESAAIAKGRAWLRAECKRRKLSPPKFA
jgi:hypothetical protein